MNFKQPFFTLKISSLHCGYRLAVNGFPIDDNLTGEPVTIEHPINAWIKTGHNSFDIHGLNIATPTGKKGIHEAAKLTMEVIVKEFGTENTLILSTTHFDATQLPRLECGHRVDYEDIALLEPCIQGSSLQSSFNIVDQQKQNNEDGAFKVLPYQVCKGPHKALSIMHSMELETPFPLWKMFESDDLITHFGLNKEEKIQAKSNLLEVYNTLWDALINKDTKALEQFFELRCSEYDIAYYTKPGQNRYELIVHLLSFVNSDDWQKADMLIGKVAVFVAYNNKSTWLHTPKHPMISGFKFNHTSADLETRIPMMWAQFDGKWEIVR